MLRRFLLIPTANRAILAIILVNSLVSAFAAPQEQKFKSYDEVFSSGIPALVLSKVIARDGKSKNYDDLLPLDGGTVGIAHFAVGGLAALYKQMDTQKYFNKTQSHMIANFSSKCRPLGRSGNDTGWGCFSNPVWYNGMRAFLKSDESRKVQNEAWITMMRPVVERALEHGWTDARSIAIALGIANSLGQKGFESLAKKCNWDAQNVLVSYVGSNKHRIRRQQAIDSNFPKSN